MTTTEIVHNWLEIYARELAGTKEEAELIKELKENSMTLEQSKALETQIELDKQEDIYFSND